MTWRFHWQNDGRYFVVWQMFMLCINCYLSGKIYSSIKTIIIFFKCRNFRPRINNAINMRLLWLTFVIIQCAFVFVIYTLLWGVSFICQVTLFHCTRLSCTLNIKSTKKRLGFGFLIIQLIIIIFFFLSCCRHIICDIFFNLYCMITKHVHVWGGDRQSRRTDFSRKQ